MAKGQFNIKIDLPLIFWMIALLAAHKPLLLLDFHRSFNDTRTTFLRKTAYLGGFSAFLVCFLQFGRLLFCVGSRGGNTVDTRTRIVAETAKSLTHP